MIIKRIDGKWLFRGKRQELKKYELSLTQRIGTESARKDQPIITHIDYPQLIALQKQLFGVTVAEMGR
jgi:hypothetical protein